VLSAGALDVRVGSTFYVQNTGSRTVPAGLFVPLGTFSVSGNGQQPFAMIVNGGFASSPLDLFGSDAYDAFKNANADRGGFAVTSRLNGCLLTATVCQVGFTFDPLPGIQDEIRIQKDPKLDDTPEIEPEDAGEVKDTSPIPPPMQLIDTHPLTPLGDIDEPVAGSGNPGLMGVGMNSQGEPK